MVSSITLGNFGTQNGKTVVTGGSSGGIDTQGLIDGLSEAKRLPAVQLEARIKQNATLSTAYGEMQTILNRFKDAANFLRNPPGVQNATSNIFEYRNAQVSNNGATAGSGYLSVTATPGAAVSSYDITVDQLATYNVKVTESIFAADADATVVGAASTITPTTITIGAAAVNVDLAEGDSLNQIAAKINAVKNQTKVTATVVKVADGEFRLSFKTMETGAAYNYANPVFDLNFVTETDAVDAQMTIDGTTITRSKNSISDVVDGLTFNLLNATPPADTLTVGLEADTSLVKDAIFNFVDAYNEFRIFAAKQMETGNNGAPLESAVLSSSSTLRSVVSRVNSEIAQVVNGILAGNPDRLADIGITFNDFPGDADTPLVRNVLNIDEAKLESALKANFEQVRSIFEFDFTTTDPNLTVFSRTNSLAVSSILLNIDQTNGIYEATYDDGSGPVTIQLDGEAMSGVDGVVLRGRAGTVLEGLVLLYADGDDATVTLNMTQGVADRVFNTLEDVVKSGTGVLATELKNITDTNTRLQTEIDRIDQRIIEYRDRLLRQFSALEQAISQANILLQSLAAQTNAQLAASG